MGNPIKFEPEYGDSTLTYDLTLAVRHSSDYNYNNLCVVIDLISDKGKVVRKEVNFSIADEFGNFNGGGFGAYYQLEHKVLKGVKPTDATHVVVWPAMKGCKMLLGLSNIGIFITPTKK